MRLETPPHQHVRLAGRLDTIRYSDRMFTLKLETGVTLRGFAKGVRAETLAGLFGRTAVVSATAVFRPSGKVLRLEADHLEPGDQDFVFWSWGPRPIGGPLEPRELRVPQPPRSGLNAIIGRWPGDESEAEIAAALGELSRFQRLRSPDMPARTLTQAMQVIRYTQSVNDSGAS